MQRIGEEQKAIHQTGTLGHEQCGLPAAVGGAAEDNATGTACAHELHCPAQTGAIACGARRGWWPLGTRLTERKIAPEHGRAPRGERVGHRAQHGSIVVTAGAMREDEHVVPGRRRSMQNAADRHVTGVVHEPLEGGGHAAEDSAVVRWIWRKTR